jgi:hypothetical protein
MSEISENFPDRVTPYITLDELNQPVSVIQGPFRLVGSSEGTLDANLAFRWLPSTAIAFEGTYSCPDLRLETEPWFLETEGEMNFRVPVIITHVSLGPESSHVRGIVQEVLDIGAAPFDMLRFSLANFPEYIGSPVRYQSDDYQSLIRTRLEAIASHGRFRLDVIPEASELRKSASRDAGFVISHVGEWFPLSGRMTIAEAEAALAMLHFWFGLLRGAWAGPLFPQGLVQGNVVWRQFASWRLSETREVASWMPQRKPLDLSDLFSGFVQRWNDPTWRGPLRSSISWLVEANSSRTALESKIVLSHVALDLLAWVHLVETQRLHSRSDFKRLSAAGRIRVLLDHIRIPAMIPDYLTHLPTLNQGDAFDGPGVITRVRNALVHATEDNRAVIESLDGLHLLECSQLALQYLELALLAVCGHSGHYARRGWRGWKGDDEILVPWAA